MLQNIFINIIFFIIVNKTISHASKSMKIDIELHASKFEFSKINFYAEFAALPLTTTKIKFTLIDDDTQRMREFGFGVLQVHSYIHNVSLTKRHRLGGVEHGQQNGTDLGFLLGRNKRAEVFDVYSYNYCTVNVSVAVILYNISALIPAQCDDYKSQVDSPVVPLLTIADPFANVKIITPKPGPPFFSPSQENLTDWCENQANVVVYESFYKFLPQSNMNSEIYFEALRKFLEVDSVRNYAKVAAKHTQFSSNQKNYVSIANTLSIFNTIVHVPNGTHVIYIPVAIFPAASESSSLKADYCNVIYLFVFVLLVASILIALKMRSAKSTCNQKTPLLEENNNRKPRFTYTIGDSDSDEVFESPRTTKLRLVHNQHNEA